MGTLAAMSRRFPSRQRLGRRLPTPIEGRRLVGLNIRLLRQAAGLSQEELALAAGINRTYLSSVERGQRNVSIDNICRIAAALDCHPRELLN